MKKFTMLYIVVMLSALAYAASVSKVTTVAVANIATEPTLATAGLPVEVNPGGPELRRLIVTAKQPDDGGLEVTDLSVVAFRAWKYTIQGQQPDAGVLFRWSRMPELDMSYTTDGGAPYVTHNNGLSMSVAVPLMGNGSRLTYTAHNAAAVDGGQANIDLVIEGRYVDPSHP